MGDWTILLPIVALVIFIVGDSWIARKQRRAQATAVRGAYLKGVIVGVEMAQKKLRRDGYDEASDLLDGVRASGDWPDEHIEVTR